MVIEKITTKIKCDASGCSNLGEFKIINKRLIFNGAFYFCRDCITELYNLIGEIIIPKGIRPLYKKKGVKDE